MKIKRGIRVFSCFIICTISCSIIASCLGVSTPDGYLATNADTVSFVQFTEKDNQLSGHIQDVTETNDIPPQTKSSTAAFTGIQNGSSVTITISIFGFSSSVTGTLDGDTLTLEIPQQDGQLQNETFNGASIQQYNQAIDTLQKQVSKQDQQYYSSQATATAIQATQTMQQNQQQAVSNANSSLRNAMNSLTSDIPELTSFSTTETLNGYAKDWQQMQKDYAIEQKDAQAGCVNSYQVGTDNYQVGTDDYQIGTDDYSLGTDKYQYDATLSAVQNDVQSIKDGWTQLQQAVANNTTMTMVATYTSTDVNNALQNAQIAEKTAYGRWQAAQSSAAQYDQETNALNKKADALSTSMHCS